MATSHSLYPQKPKQFHRTGKCIEVGGLIRGSLNHHHLSLNEHVCIYLSLLKEKNEKEWIIVNTQMLLKQNVMNIGNQCTHHKRSHPQELIPKEDSNNKYGTHHCKPHTVTDKHDYRLYGIHDILPRRARVTML
jgi:hypothetical protein